MRLAPSRARQHRLSAIVKGVIRGTRNEAIISLFAAWLAMSLAGCKPAEPKPTESKREQAIAPGIIELGRIRDPRITESSGVVASRRYPKVLWTHNDGGGPKKQVLYAIDREGGTIAAFPVVGAELHDWEDIAIDNSGHLYVGDIGNNDVNRTTLAVYEIDEPNPAERVIDVPVKRKWKLKFPDAPFDCESLFIWKDNGYLISKVFGDAPAQIFRFPLKKTDNPLTLELVATTTIPSPVTAADISADGNLLGLVAKDGAFVYRIDGDVGLVSTGTPYHTKLKNEHIEGCCFVPDGLLATSESREILLFIDPPFRGSKALKSQHH